MVVDSGCVWHVVKDSSIPINTRPCADTMYGSDGVECECSTVGDLPLLAMDSKGILRKTTIRNVRCVPEFVCPMLSLGQLLWDDSQLDVIFRDVRCLRISTPDGEVRSPFHLEKDLLYRWSVQTPGGDHSCHKGATPLGSALTVSRINSGSAGSHIGILSAAEAREVLHTRLHVSASVIRKLPKCSADAPEVLRHCPKIACGICTEANATKVSFSSSSNHPSSKPSFTKRPGQLWFAPTPLAPSSAQRQVPIHTHWSSWMIIRAIDGCILCEKRAKPQHTYAPSSLSSTPCSPNATARTRNSLWLHFTPIMLANYFLRSLLSYSTRTKWRNLLAAYTFTRSTASPRGP